MAATADDATADDATDFVDCVSHFLVPPVEHKDIDEHAWTFFLEFINTMEHLYSEIKEYTRICETQYHALVEDTREEANKKIMEINSHRGHVIAEKTKYEAHYARVSARWFEDMQFATASLFMTAKLFDKFDQNATQDPSKILAVTGQRLRSMVNAYNYAVEQSAEDQKKLQAMKAQHEKRLKHYQADLEVLTARATQIKNQYDVDVDLARKKLAARRSTRSSQNMIELQKLRDDYRIRWASGAFRCPMRSHDDAFVIDIMSENVCDDVVKTDPTCSICLIITKLLEE